MYVRICTCYDVVCMFLLRYCGYVYIYIIIAANTDHYGGVLEIIRTWCVDVYTQYKMTVSPRPFSNQNTGLTNKTYDNLAFLC